MYPVSWKGSAERSGGLGTNIGIHFFDLLVWLFGGVDRCLVHLNEPKRMGGTLALRRADVKWFLSVDPGDLPFPAAPGRPLTHRSLTVDGAEIEMSEGFSDLHTRVYEEILAGRGHGIDVARPSVELAYRVRTAAVTPAPADAHPLLARPIGRMSREVVLNHIAVSASLGEGSTMGSSASLASGFESGAGASSVTTWWSTTAPKSATSCGSTTSQSSASSPCARPRAR